MAKLMRSGVAVEVLCVYVELLLVFHVADDDVLVCVLVLLLVLGSSVDTDLLWKLLLGSISGGLRVGKAPWGACAATPSSARLSSLGMKYS